MLAVVDGFTYRVESLFFIFFADIHWRDVTSLLLPLSVIVIRHHCYPIEVFRQDGHIVACKINGFQVM